MHVSQKKRKPKVALRDLAFESVGSLSRALRVELPELLALVKTCEDDYPYRSWQEPKRSGNGFRLIEDPLPSLKSMQRRINRLLQRLSLPETFHGSLSGTSILSNAFVHRRKSWFITFDLANYYRTIRPKKVYDGLVMLGSAPDVARAITRLVTTRGHVPQGAPTSPIIAAIAMLKLTRRFERLASPFRGIHTIYGDNVCVSGPQALVKQAKKMFEIVQSEGFALRPNKTLTAEPGAPKPLPGLLVQDGRPTVYPDELEMLTAVVDACARIRPDLLAKKVCCRFPRRLAGMLNHYGWIDSAAMRPVVARFDAIYWASEDQRKPCMSPTCECWPQELPEDFGPVEYATSNAALPASSICPFDA